MKPGDRVLIYHSGHGARYPQDNVCVEGLQTYTKGKFTVADVLSEADDAMYENKKDRKNKPKVTEADELMEVDNIDPILMTPDTIEHSEIIPPYNYSPPPNTYGRSVNEKTFPLF